MKKKMKKLVAGILVAALVIAGAAPASEVETVFAGTTEEQIKTPAFTGNQTGGGKCRQFER